MFSIEKERRAPRGQRRATPPADKKYNNRRWEGMRLLIDSRPRVVLRVWALQRMQYVTWVRSRAGRLANYPLFTGVTSNIGSLNPDLYKSPLIPEEDTSNYPEGHLGRFWFSINYDLEQEKLLINLIRIHNLPSRDKDSTTACDPLVRYIPCVLCSMISRALHYWKWPPPAGRANS